MQLFDVVAVGDAIVDLLVTLDAKGNHYTVEKDTITLMLGEKIPVAASSFSLGGNATHVAIGLSRLGFRTALAAELGTDEFAQKILADLDKEKVGKSLLKQTPHALSTFTVSVSAGRDRTTLVRHIPREHNFSFDAIQAQWVFLSSMGEKWEDAYKTTLDFVGKSHAQLAFNPGSIQLQKGVDSFIDVIKACDILFVNKEEAEEILYKEILPAEKKEAPEALLFRLNRMGPKIVVLTDGANGSYAIDSIGKVYTQPVFPVVVTEKTGAGDAFAAGFLAGQIAGKDIQTSLLFGTADAAGVISKHGGQEGLLTKKELEDMIREKS